MASDARVFEVRVEVQHKEGVADPEGSTIERSLPTLGFEGARGVRVGKCIRFTLDAPDADSARTEVEEMCARFLTNPVIEDSSIELTEVSPA